MDEFEKLVSEAQDQRNEDWYQERIGKFTASKFASLNKRGRGKDNPFGDVSLSYIYEKVAEIMTGHFHEVFGKALEHGTEQEPFAIAEYQKQTGNKVNRIGFVNWNEYAGGSPDGLIGEDKILEVKCPWNSANHVKVMLTDEVPADHMWQVQFNLMCTGRDKADYVSYDERFEPELRLHVIQVEKDEEMIEQIQDRLKEAKEKLDELLNKLK